MSEENVVPECRCLFPLYRTANTSLVSSTVIHSNENDPQIIEMQSKPPHQAHVNSRFLQYLVSLIYSCLVNSFGVKQWRMILMLETSLLLNFYLDKKMSELKVWKS